MLSLREWVASLGDMVPAVSRLVLTTGPGCTAVIARFAGHTADRQVEIKDGLTRPMSGPRRLTDDGPDAVLHAYRGIEDQSGRIRSAGLPEQIADLEASGLLGTLNVERLGGGRRVVISTHAGTQAERNEWLLGRL